MRHKSFLSHQARADRRKEIAIYAEEHGPEKASIVFKVSEYTVRRACIENSKKPRRDPFVRARLYGHSHKSSGVEAAFRILSMELDGKKRSEISAELGISRQYISYIVGLAIKHGICLSH